MNIYLITGKPAVGKTTFLQNLKVNEFDKLIDDVPRMNDLISLLNYLNKFTKNLENVYITCGFNITENNKKYLKSNFENNIALQSDTLKKAQDTLIAPLIQLVVLMLSEHIQMVCNPVL